MAAVFDVFLSHSSVDKPWVIKLKDDLLRYGVSVWLDKDEIKPGDIFIEVLETALDNSRTVALIVSPESVGSGWVREEYHRALNLEKRRPGSLQIIPVLLREAELPGFLQNRSWLNFQDESTYAQRVWELVWGITGEQPPQVLDLNAPAPPILLSDEYINSLEHDIYISYADFDNEPILGYEDGWVTLFCQEFKKRLQTLLGETPRILRCNKPPDSAYVNQNFLKQLRHTAIMISVLSPSYVNSQACMEEFAYFQRTAEEHGVWRIDGEPRIFKLVKTDIDNPPPETYALKSYEFFEKEPESDREKVYYPQLGGDDLKKYLRKLDDLTLDVKKVLTMVKNRKKGLTVLPETSGATVFLAETTSDLDFKREQIERDLKAHGHTVLPDRPLPVRDPVLEHVIQGMLEQSDLSVHLIGDRYGIIPEETTRSLSELQNSVAAKYCLRSDFSRVIWFPADLNINTLDDERQLNFITALQTNADAQCGADLLQTSIENLKTEILDKIKYILEKPPTPDTPPSGDDVPIRVYLIYDQRDREDISPLGDYLYNRGFELLEPIYDNGNAEEARQLHYDYLGVCDAALIYYGQTSGIWLQKKLNDLRKVAGYGRTTPMLAKAVYIGGPENPQKERFRSREVDEVFKGFTTFSPQIIAPFLTRIEEYSNGRD